MGEIRGALYFIKGEIASIRVKGMRAFGGAEKREASGRGVARKRDPKARGYDDRRGRRSKKNKDIARTIFKTSEGTQGGTWRFVSRQSKSPGLITTASGENRERREMN